MDIGIDILLPFVAGYEMILLSLFALAVCMMVTRTYSQGLYAFSIVSVVLFLIFTNVVFIAVAVASVVTASVLKNYGL